MSSTSENSTQILSTNLWKEDVQIIDMKAYPIKSMTLKTLSQMLEKAEEKIAEDILRFRTCCADPRASK